MSDLAQLSAHEAAEKLASGEITSEMLVTDCLEVISSREDVIGAWTSLDRDYALEQARALDTHREAGQPIGPLHGVPVGIKDIFDTADMASENGTVLDAGRRPDDDSAAVSRIRQAGGIVMGKTVTTEFAFFSPGKTTNPHNAKHTPGGSSSGSAAAVASNMVPLSLGTQTNGSVIRPAAYCGIYGLKPTHGLISRAGVLKLSSAFDTVGIFARDLKDLSLLGDCLIGYDPNDPSTRPYAPANLAATLDQDVPVEPSFAFVKSSVWDKADASTQGAFAELADYLAEQCDEVDLPEPFANVHDWHHTVMIADFAKNLGSYYARGKDQISDVMNSYIEEGQKVLAVDYNIALEWREVLLGGLEQIFSRYDAIITPSAPGQAPAGLETTGDPSFCTIWTFCGLPAVNLPVFFGENNLPMGLQIVGPHGQDGRLLRTARWLVEKLNEDDE